MAIRALFGSDGSMIQMSVSFPFRLVEEKPSHFPSRDQVRPVLRDLPSVSSVMSLLVRS